MREALKKGINYKFNEEIKMEFEDMKKEIMDAGFLEPYDLKMNIYGQTDASKLGLGYVLYRIEGNRKINDVRRRHKGRD